MTKLMNFYQKMPDTLKATVWCFFCVIIQRGISMLTTPIFTRLMSTEEYGQFTVFNSWMNIITIFVGFNLSAGVYQQGLIKYEQERAVFSSSMQGLSTAMIAGWTVIYLAFSSFWNELFSLTTVQMLAMLVIIWTSSVFNFWSSEQRVLYKYKKLVMITIFVAISQPLLGIILVTHSEEKATARILGLAIVSLAAYTGLFFEQMHRGRHFYSKEFWKYAFLYNLPLLPHYLSQSVLNCADSIMIERMVGKEEAGIYGLAYSISLIMTLFNTALGQTLSPWMYQKIKDKKLQDMSSPAYLTMLTVAAANLILIISAPEIIAIFAPAKYAEAVNVIPPIVMSVFFMYCYDLFAKFSFYYEKSHFIMTASIIAALANLVLNAVAIPIFGYYAAGYTTLICYILYSAGHYLFMTRICRQFCQGKMPYDIKILLGISAGFLLLGIGICKTYPYPVLRYGIIAAAAAAAFIKRKALYKLFKQLMSLNRKED